MFQVTAKTDYGLLLMVALGRSFGNGPVSLRQLAEDQHLPYRFLSQIAIPLRQAGLIEAKEGVNGGYRLSRSTEKITVGEIVRALEGPIGLVKCLARDFGSCPSEEICMLPSFWHKVGVKLNQAIDGLSLAELVETPRNASLQHVASRAS